MRLKVILLTSINPLFANNLQLGDHSKLKILELNLTKN